MFKYLLLLLLSPLAIADDSCPYRQGAAIIGVATDSKTNDFLYCEYHFLKDRQSAAINAVTSLDNVVFSEVEYRNNKQELIAQKKADFSKNRLVPVVEQIDFRHNEKVSIQQQADNVSNAEQVVLKVRYQEPNTDSMKEIEVGLGENTIADAGFDNAIRVYWDDVLSNDKVILDFVAPPQQTTLALSVKQQSLKRCQKLSSVVYTEEEHLCIKVKAANIILNWLVKPIYLVYERASKRLLIFSGHVNVTDSNGEGQDATIEYRYQ